MIGYLNDGLVEDIGTGEGVSEEDNTKSVATNGHGRENG